MDNIERIDIQEFAKQRREELLKMPHSLTLEVVMPPIDMFTLLKGNGIFPSVSRYTNQGCNDITVAMTIFTLKEYIEAELEDESIKHAYDLITDMMRCEHIGSAEYKEEDKNE